MEPVMNQKPLAICDVSLQDGFQCLYAGRGRTADMVRMAALMDDVGFWAVEVWGGTGFDVMHRELNEDPWERIRSLKRYFTKTPMACMLRGQHLVGERCYGDDVVRAFVERSHVNGIRVFRLFDPMNDLRNLQVAGESVLQAGAHFQGCICYSRTAAFPEEESLYTLEYYVKKAIALQNMGAHSLLIKDTAGLLMPGEARKLVAGLKAAVSLPLHIHTHATAGFGPLSLFAAVEAGADGADTCLAPFAMRSSHGAVEPLIAALKGGDRDTGLDLERIAPLNRLSEEEILPKYWHFYGGSTTPMDTTALIHSLPGGMEADLKRQLEETGAEDRLDAVFKELERVRRDLGNPPLVRPLIRILGTQAVNNVLFDTEGESYRMISSQIRDFCAGLHGEPPGPLDAALRKKALEGHPRGVRPLRERPGEALKPELPGVREELRGLAADIEDELLCALFPVTGKRFLRWKYGKETPPEYTLPRTLEEAMKIRERMIRILAGEHKITEPEKVPEKSPYIRTFNVFVDDTYYEVGVDEVGGAPVIRHAFPLTPPAAEKKTLREADDAGPVKKAQASIPAPANDGDEGTPLVAPMPGMVVSFRKKEGDSVKAGETVVILEAMKMENALVAPVSGVILTLSVRSGDSVAKDAVLCRIG
ncbi:pyruvate carboxylase subunit B [Desulfobotulus alkaliphilus]|uniref:Pyruvate carboxylase subunit B n=1 Tax=Desulfobotulus alkaliphilus TaxID=622671 RepID=A0A562RZ44_9BACT|nr:pyruvate carboxylase subunit B [Desulfobotulus alkaliphilus]TWI74188.1 pyruvate carboxylase subunit B [Desulfobotulus alkaliphilus]